MLVIGDIGRWAARGREVPRIERCHFAASEDLSGDLLRRIRPDFVVSALIGNGVDALEIAQLLSDLDFNGSYRAIADGLPDPDSVREEVRARAPGLDFDILMVPENGALLYR